MEEVRTTIALWLIRLAQKLSKNTANQWLDPDIAIDCPPIARQNYDIRKASCVQSVPKHIIDGIIESEREDMLQSVIRNVKNKFINELNLEDVMECKISNSDDNQCYLINISLNILAPSTNG